MSTVRYTAFRLEDLDAEKILASLEAEQYSGSWAPLPWASGHFSGAIELRPDAPAEVITDEPAHCEAIWEARWRLCERFRPLAAVEQYCVPVILPLVRLEPGTTSVNLPTALFKSMAAMEHLSPEHLYFVCVQGAFELHLPRTPSPPRWNDHYTGVAELTEETMARLYPPAGLREDRLRVQGRGEGYCWQLDATCAWDYHRLTAVSAEPAVGFYVAFQRPTMSRRLEDVCAMVLQQHRSRTRCTDELALTYRLREPPVRRRLPAATASLDFDIPAVRHWHCFFHPVAEWPRSATGGKRPSDYARPQEDPSFSSEVVSEEEEEEEEEETLPAPARVTPVPLVLPTAYMEGLRLVDELLDSLRQRYTAIMGTAPDARLFEWFDQFNGFEHTYEGLVNTLQHARAAAPSDSFFLLDQKAAEGKEARKQFHKYWTEICLPRIGTQLASMPELEQEVLVEAWAFAGEAPAPSRPQKRAREPSIDPPPATKRARHDPITFTPFPPLDYFATQ